MQNREKIVKKRKPLFELKSTNYHADGAYYTPGLRKFKLLDTLLIESHLLKYVVKIRTLTSGQVVDICHVALCGDLLRCPAKITPQIKQVFDLFGPCRSSILRLFRCSILICGFCFCRSSMEFSFDTFTNHCKGFMDSVLKLFLIQTIREFHFNTGVVGLRRVFALCRDFFTVRCVELEHFSRLS